MRQRCFCFVFLPALLSHRPHRASPAHPRQPRCVAAGLARNARPTLGARPAPGLFQPTPDLQCVDHRLSAHLCLLPPGRRSQGVFSVHPLKVGGACDVQWHSLPPTRRRFLLSHIFQPLFFLSFAVDFHPPCSGAYRVFLSRFPFRCPLLRFIIIFYLT